MKQKNFDQRTARIRHGYVRPQTCVVECESQSMIAGTVRAKGSDWTDGGEQTVEFNFEGSSGAKETIVTFSDIWENE